MEYTLCDTKNELGFGQDTEVLVDLEYYCRAGSPPGWDDPGDDPECNIQGWNVMSIVTENDEDINWSTLSAEKQKQINNWIDDEVNTNEVYDSIFQHEEDYWEGYKADMKEQAEKYGY